ncbi:hypothetical protein BDF21DRAFT_458294 [Thamnidium elegans]|uniref:Uncharacterized protein n=1 Tax=Thamnidium elegans TaxID=101142 RepID=A0A8H7SZ28_9FUNG|nr:hypothetical protein INT48_001831 [Thamnidium elegans]KAI8096055.1 hypothetical protein BDF21DRAFT_458294 [Thamnidium elegans]
MKALIFRLPKSLLNITVKNEGMKEMFEQGAFDNERTFSVKISTPKKLWSDESEEGGTPPFISEWYEKQLEALTVYKNRSKYALNYTQEFIPNEILQNFPRLRTTQYRTVIYETPFGKDTTNNTNILTDVERLKDLLMHSIIQSQQYNWILITEVRVVYRKNKEINVDPSNKYPNTLVVTKENICSSERAWYELRFEYKKFEVIATGGYYNQDDSNDFGTFVGTAAPDHMARDTQFILLSPVIPAKTTSKPKNFKKVNKSNKWRFKSVLFSEK